MSLSESACLRRVRALEESGLIQGYTALIDQTKAGFPVSVFVNITLDRQSQAGLEAFESAVRKIPEVMECYLMTGEHDYLLRLVVADMEDFERVHQPAPDAPAERGARALELRHAHRHALDQPADEITRPLQRA